MLRDRATRRVATVLFVDVVDSTRVAAEVGDARWRELVAAFRTTVRRQLKRLSGHEVDTAGDGFFATFDTPASALRAAAAIVADVQSIGLDVRCGLHTGELERIDGRLGGIAAHIGARVMAHADAAQVLTTGTVRDLVVGGAMAFEPVGDFELKGVPGTWALHRLTSVDRIALPVALAAEVAASRRANRARPSTRGRPVLVGAVAATAIAVAAIAVYAGTRPDPSGAAASTAPPSASGSANASASPEPIALVRIDPGRREIAQIVPGEWDPGLGGLIASNGNLWYGNETTLIPLDPSTGERREPFELPPETYKVDPADGSLWVGHGMDRFQTVVDRLDPLSYRNLGQIDPGEEVWDHVVTNRAIYMVTRGEGESGVSEVLELDPSTGELKDRDPTGFDIGPFYIGVVGDLVTLWSGQRVSLFDPTSDTLVMTIEGPQIGRGPYQFDTQTGLLWAGDRDRGTVTPYRLDDGEAEVAIGLDGNPRGMAIDSEAIWIAAEEFVYRLDRYTRKLTPIPMPEGVTALSIAVDEATSTIWVSSCSSDCEDFPL